ncbi:hypothetical protein [Candidatus Thiodiazotropha endoloripes]|uniref:hypothetical protein n=1 Tax=Candidatus Thiodiazotropha endoloripes TaxID=1818881 RepID=UPI00114CDD6B|nr:hypothetical protein [Candidatus Thiodiazotropha endoloripes]
MSDVNEYSKEELAQSFIWTTQPLGHHLQQLEQVYRVMEGAIEKTGRDYPEDQLQETERILAYFADAITGIRKVRQAIIIEGQRLLETEFQEDKH